MNRSSLFHTGLQEQSIKNPLCLDWPTSNINSSQNNLFQHLGASPRAHWCTDREEGTSAGLYHAHLQMRMLLSSSIYLISGTAYLKALVWNTTRQKRRCPFSSQVSAVGKKCVFAMQISATAHLVTSMWHVLPWKGCIFHFWCSWPIKREQSFRSSVLLHYPQFIHSSTNSGLHSEWIWWLFYSSSAVCP